MDVEESRQSIALRALKRYRTRVHRVVLARRRDLEEAQLAPTLRRAGEALLTYIREVPARAAEVSLPDPHDPERKLAIALDPALSVQANAARYFKRAARAERGLAEIPSRLAQAEATQNSADKAIARLQALAAEEAADDERVQHEIDLAVGLIPEGLRSSLGLEAAQAMDRRPAAKTDGAKPKEERAPSAKLQPRRLTTTEGWDVLIGRSNEGNDYLTMQMARPEDYWFHVHGAAGSHVVLRRGKGKNEPSKQTIEEVASWAAFYSKAATAGKVSVIFTRKKYVRKPRGSKPGLVTCEREKSVMVRPKEPKPAALSNETARS
jgi:predicted ribosome quality control (RQC) complex YloA/Tae2 family protein